MIDVKTRDRILELWKNGYSKSAIKRKTDVSLPTIRKIIRDAGLDNKLKQHEEPDLEERVKAMETMMYELTLSIKLTRAEARTMGRDCGGVDDEGFCIFHPLDEEVDRDLLNVKREEDEDLELGYGYYANVEEHPLFCAFCTHLDWRTNKMWDVQTILNHVDVPLLKERVKNMGEELEMLMKQVKDLLRSQL